MTPENEVITIDKQALIRAALEMERQEVYRHLELEEYIENLESTASKLRDFLTIDPAFSARAHLLDLFLPGREWGKIMSDELLEQWELEFQSFPKKS